MPPESDGSAAGEGRSPSFERTTELLRQAVAGRQRAWSAFYRRYHRLVRRVVRATAPRWLLAREEGTPEVVEEAVGRP